MPHVTKLQTGRPSKDYGTGRLCSYPGCSNTLSRYNPDTVCASHSLKLSYNVKCIKQETKRCSHCGEDKPLTPEFFRRRKASFESQCKVCVNMKRRVKKDLQLEEDGKRRCSKCHKVKPLDQHNWKAAPEDSQGFSEVCSECTKEEWKNSAREGRKRKVLQAEG